MHPNLTCVIAEPRGGVLTPQHRPASFGNTDEDHTYFSTRSHSPWPMAHSVMGHCDSRVLTTRRVHMAAGTWTGRHGDAGVCLYRSDASPAGVCCRRREPFYSSDSNAFLWRWPSVARLVFRQRLEDVGRGWGVNWIRGRRRLEDSSTCCSVGSRWMVRSNSAHGLNNPMTLMREGVSISLLL